jgi:hypothetical protein
MSDQVAIVAMGSSRDAFTMLAVQHQPPELCMPAHSEIWCINTMAAVLRCDRAIVMDPADQLEKHCPSMWARLKLLDVPVYTTDPSKYRNGVRYPIELILKDLRFPYINNSVAAAVALALLEGKKTIGVFGADFTYPHIHHGEEGRACTEWWLALAAARGVNIVIPQGSTLMDQHRGFQIYGWQREPGNEHAGCLTPGEVLARLVEREQNDTAADLLTGSGLNGDASVLHQIAPMVLAGNQAALGVMRNLVTAVNAGQAPALSAALQQIQQQGDPAKVAPVMQAMQAALVSLQPVSAPPMPGLPAGAATENIYPMKGVA